MHAAGAVHAAGTSGKISEIEQVVLRAGYSTVIQERKYNMHYTTQHILLSKYYIII